MDHATPSAVIQPTLLYDMLKYLRTILTKPFHNGSFQQLNPHGGGEITKSSLRRTHCELWVYFLGWAQEADGKDTENITFAKQCLTNLQIILQS